MLMAESEQWELLTEILRFHPNLNLKDWPFGNCLLWYVVLYKNEIRNQIAKKLIDMGANPYSQNSNGKSPMDIVILRKNEELIDIFSRVDKPLQEEPEKFRVPKKRSGIFPVKMRDYMKFICIEDASIGYIKDKIVDYDTICGGEKRKYKFKLVPIEGSKWIIVCCPNRMDFYNYHNLMSWIWGISGDTDMPRQTICVAVHVNDVRLSYYGIMDKSKYGDRIVGRFQNGESFSVYLPEANKKEGNAKSYSDVLPIKKIGHYLESCGLDEIWVEKAANMSGEEIEVEMAV